MIDEAPNPMIDPEGYELWCELHQCTVCEGIGEDDDPTFHCKHCDGTGIEPEEEPVE